MVEKSISGHIDHDCTFLAIILNIDFTFESTLFVYFVGKSLQAKLPTP